MSRGFQLNPEAINLAAKLTKDASDAGKLIEAGWIALRALAVPPDAQPVQIDEMRNAFFAGAQHLFGSIMSILDPGEDPTDADLGRMDLIQAELDEFITDFGLRHIKPERSS